MSLEYLLKAGVLHVTPRGRSSHGAARAGHDCMRHGTEYFIFLGIFLFHQDEASFIVIPLDMG